MSSCCRSVSCFALLNSQPLASKNEDLGKGYEKQADKQATFQIYVDEPDAACTKNPPQAVKASSSSTAAAPEESPLAISNAVARLRQPLATIDVPLAMDVSFGGLQTHNEQYWIKCCPIFALHLTCKTLLRLSHGHVYGWGRGQASHSQWGPWICCWDPCIP